MYQSDISQVIGQERDKTLGWLTTTDYMSRQSNVLKYHQPGTGHWLLHLSEYPTWKANQSQVLHCSGVPGSGKTVRVLAAIDDLW
jgi:hypothetical protein